MSHGDDRLNHRLESDVPGLSIRAATGSRWGELLLPPAAPLAADDDALRLFLISSFAGTPLLDTVIEHPAARMGRITVPGAATDDIASSDARINAKKRFWKAYEPKEQFESEDAVCVRALRAGIPIYTGELKIPFFRDLLASWAPDAIIVQGCGQLLDEHLLSVPRLGTYNLHPSDIAHHHGLGAEFYDDLVARQPRTTRWTVHQMTLEVDSGPIVGQSPEIRVTATDDRVVDDARLLHRRMGQAVPGLLRRILEELLELDRTATTPRLTTIDFESTWPGEDRAALLEPIAVPA